MDLLYKETNIFYPRELYFKIIVHIKLDKKCINKPILKIKNIQERRPITHCQKLLPTGINSLKKFKKEITNF